MQAAQNLGTLLTVRWAGAALAESGEDPVVTKYLCFGGKRVAMERTG
ncbi:MAG: hypothetical protein PVI67_02905 [Anaerolineae bacterium]|jgi:hypothetical protein